MDELIDTQDANPLPTLDATRANYRKYLPDLLDDKPSVRHYAALILLEYQAIADNIAETHIALREEYAHLAPFLLDDDPYLRDLAGHRMAHLRRNPYFAI